MTCSDAATILPLYIFPNKNQILVGAQAMESAVRIAAVGSCPTPDHLVHNLL